MGRKKIVGANQAPESGDLVPFCYYCDREFDDVKVLVHHQRTRHFCCNECGRTFESVTSLRVHMLNSYKKSLKEVPNALPGRDNPDVVVHGMDGFPKGILEERMQKLKSEADSELPDGAKEEEKDKSKGGGKTEPSSPPPKSGTAMDASPEPPRQLPEQHQQVATLVSSPGTGAVVEPPPPPDEDVDAALADLPPALKLLAPELREASEQEEGVPDAIASLHGLAVKALAAFGFLQPSSNGTSRIAAALQTAMEVVKNPRSTAQTPVAVPAAPTGIPGMPLPVSFMQTPTMVAPQPRMGPPQMGCFPGAHFAPMQGGPMSTMPHGLAPGRPPPGVPTPAQGYVPSAQNMACGGCPRPRTMPFQPMPLGTMPQMGGPTMPLGGMAMQLPNSGLVMEPAEKRAKLDV